MQKSSSKTTSLCMYVTTKTVSTGIFCISFYLWLLTPYICESIAVCSPSYSAKSSLLTNNSCSTISVGLKLYQQSQILFPLSQNYSPADSQRERSNWSSVLLKIRHMRGVQLYNMYYTYYCFLLVFLSLLYMSSLWSLVPIKGALLLCILIPSQQR